jgi:2-keto-4-pentenoate hydratase
MTNEDLISLADALMQAERDRKPVPPLTDTFPDMTDEEAYEIQLLNVRRRVERGGKIRGHKIGLTAKAMQELFGVDEPDYGHLFDDMFEYEAMTVRTERYIAPRVEIETAFILGRTIEGSNVTVADVIRAVEWVVPSIEIIDSRIRDWRIKLADTIADNGSSAGVVLGARPVRVSDLDLRNLSASCTSTTNWWRVAIPQPYLATLSPPWLGWQKHSQGMESLWRKATSFFPGHACGQFPSMRELRYADISQIWEM